MKVSFAIVFSFVVLWKRPLVLAGVESPIIVGKEVKLVAEMVTKELAKMVTKELAKMVTKELAEMVTKELAKMVTKELAKMVAPMEKTTVVNQAPHCPHLTMTPLQFIYKGNDFPNSQPTIVYGLGDGTVNDNSLTSCERWKDQQTQPIFTAAFSGVEHVSMIKNSYVIRAVKTLSTLDPD